MDIGTISIILGPDDHEQVILVSTTHLDTIQYKYRRAIGSARSKKEHASLSSPEEFKPIFDPCTTRQGLLGASDGRALVANAMASHGLLGSSDGRSLGREATQAKKQPHSGNKAHDQPHQQVPSQVL